MESHLDFEKTKIYRPIHIGTRNNRYLAGTCRPEEEASESRLTKRWDEFVCLIWHAAPKTTAASSDALRQHQWQIAGFKEAAQAQLVAQTPKEAGGSACFSGAA